MLNKEQVKQEIKAAIKLAMDNGWQIIDGSFIREGKCCCPLSALAISEGHIPQVDWDTSGLADILDWGMNQVNDFTLGYDCTVDGSNVDSEYSQLGTEIRTWVDNGCKE